MGRIMKPGNSNSKTIPINIVGGSNFGRYPKISQERTYNMLISDNWLVPYAGYRQVNFLSANGQGRGIYASPPTKLNKVLYVTNNVLYAASPQPDGTVQQGTIGTINTSSGDVYFAENEKGEIALCDKLNIYIFDWVNNNFNVADTTDFTPGYVTYQKGYFISVDLTASQWRLSSLENSLVWPSDSQSVGSFEAADVPVAAISLPGKGNSLYLMGSVITQSWYDVGLQLFPYQQNTYFNIDYGCVSAATIASNETIVVWLAQNSVSGPVIMYSDGSDPTQISTDGINFKLASLKNPAASFASLFKQDGHVLYQLTFYDAKDNFSITYDFSSKKFTDVCDQNMDIHIAKKIVAYNNNYYFVSFTDGNLYEMNSKITTFETMPSQNDKRIWEIPRIRICGNVRLPDASRFVIQNSNFTLEQGESRQTQRIDMTISVDGGATFGSGYSQTLNLFARRPNRIIWWGLGAANDFVPQYRFWGFDRFVVYDGEVNVYQ